MFADRIELEFVLSRAQCSVFRSQARGVYEPQSHERGVTHLPYPRGAPESSPLASVPAHVALERVCLINSPPTPRQYTALRDLTGAGHEQVHMVASDVALDLGLPDYDYWIIDDEYVLELDYEGHELLGGTFVVDSEAVEQYRRYRRAALANVMAPTAA